MDIDGYIVAHQGSWDRLDQLSARAHRGVRRLDPDELDELVELYQRVSSHLAHVRVAFDDLALVNRLSRSVGAARGVIYRRRSAPGMTVADFFLRSFPGAVFHARTTMAVAALLLFAPALGFGWWLTGSDTARDTRIDPELQELIAGSQFEAYYSSAAAEQFQTTVMVNNVSVGAMAFAGGILLGAPTAYLLVSNGLHIGEVGAVMHHAGKGALFWGLILPHGLLELTAIVLAAGAGLRLAWAVISPGDRTRGDALAEEGGRAMVIALGVSLCFVVAAFIEAWITPSELPTAARVGIGVVVEVAFLTYAIGLGHNAAAEGITGAQGDLRRWRDARAEASAGSLTASPSP